MLVKRALLFVTCRKKACWVTLVPRCYWCLFQVLQGTSSQRSNFRLPVLTAGRQERASLSYYHYNENTSSLQLYPTGNFTDVVIYYRLQTLRHSVTSYIMMCTLNINVNMCKHKLNMSGEFKYSSETHKNLTVWSTTHRHIL